MSEGGSTRAIVAACLANLGIAAAKMVGFLFTRSSSMLAESIHSLADTGNQVLLLLGERLSRRQATAEHPFGYGRERYFWAFVVALVLFSLGAVFSVAEGVTKLLHPHALEDLHWAIGILLVAMVLEGLSLRTAVNEANHVRNGESWPQFIRRSRAPELPVVLLEDTGALIGLLIALVAVSLSAITGEPIWDGVGTILIGLLLGGIAFVLAREMRSLLLGESATPEHRRLIVEAIDTAPHVIRLIHLRTLHIGPEELLVAAKVEFEPTLQTSGLAAAIDGLEANVRQRVTIVGPMYIEPDLTRPERLAPPEKEHRRGA